MAACAWPDGLSLGHPDAHLLNQDISFGIKTKTFRNQMEPTRSNDVPSKRGFSDCYSWLPSDYYLLPGTIPIYQELSDMT